MTTIALLAIGQATLFGQAKAAYSRTDQVRVHIEVSGPDGKFVYQLSSDLPNLARLSVSAPPRKGLAATKRIYSVNGPVGVAYDPGSSKFVKRSSLKGSLADRLGFVSGGLEAPVEYHLDPQSAVRFIESLEAQKGWSQIGRRLVLQKAGQSIGVTFDPKGLISRFEIKAKGGTLTWTAIYGKFESAIFTLPSNSVQVDRLDTPRVTVSNADAASKATLEASIRAYDRLRQVTFESDGVTCHYSNGEARQVSRDFDWSFRAGTLMIVDHRQRRISSKRVSLANLAGALSAEGISYNATLRQMMSGRNLVRRLFTTDLKVRSTGEVVIDGVACRAIEAKGQGARVSALIRKSDHLAARITFENLNLKGQVLSRSDQVFKYRPFDRANLQVPNPAGYRRS